MASLGGVLANIPGLGGYLAAQQNDQQQQLGQLQQIGGLQGILANVQKQQLQQQAAQKQEQLRGVLSQLPPDATPDQVVQAIRPFASADDILKITQGSADRRAQMEAAKANQLAQREQAMAMQGERLAQQAELARQRSEDRTLSQADQNRARMDMIRLTAQLRPQAGAAGPKAPVGYRFSSDGETLEPIPGGPKDAAGGGKPLPTQAVKLQQAELDAIGTAGAINADMGALVNQLDSGKLKLGPVKNVASEARNLAGISSEESRNYASFRATLEKIRNDSLRLNKGVQTEGDSVRAWNELIKSANDPQVVKQRLQEIQKINERAIDLRKMNVDAIRKNYGAAPMDTGAYQTQPAALGTAPAAANPIDALLEKYK